MQPLDSPDGIIVDVTNIGHYIEAHMRNSPNMPLQMVFDDGLTIEGIPQRLTRADDITLIYINVKDKLMIFKVDDITCITLKLL